MAPDLAPIVAPAPGKVTRMAMLALFKEQLEHESRALAKALGLKKRGDFLMHWYFKRLLRLPDADVQGIICDGGNDLSIDALWIDESNTVHFYNFKNPENPDKDFPSSEVDKMLGGLGLIVANKYARHANTQLRARVEEMRNMLPQAYRIHLVTSGRGIPSDAVTKLDVFVKSSFPGHDFMSWQLEDLDWLQNHFYLKSLPTVDEPFVVALAQPPYAIKAASHECYMFHMSAEELSKLFDVVGEKLLQQNIRVYQGDRSTNSLILRTATGDDADNFFNYNNGIVFLADSAQWDIIQKRLFVRRFQVVNGGQTLRVLHRAWKRSELRPNVMVPVRVITSQGDKSFANNVTVNLNHQNRIEPSFLRSNDPRMIQLANSLSSLGWYLERREDEVSLLTPDEQAAIETRIGAPLKDRVIPLKEGMQAYTATFMGLPEIAKKNPKRIFLGADDGGIYDRVFGNDLTAERVLAAYRLLSLVAEYVKQFMARRRRKERSSDWKADYAAVLGKDLVEQHGALVEQVLPQSTVFLSGLVFVEWTDMKKRPIAELIEALARREYQILNEKIAYIIQLGKKEDRSWPTILKSQVFFDKVVAFVSGRHHGDKT